MDDTATNPTPEDQAKAAAPATEAPKQLFAWQASEFIDHQKNLTWFIGLFLIAAALAGFFVWTRAWTSVALVAVMSIVVVRFAVKQPRVLNFELDDDGLRIDNKLYAYDQFTSFSVFPDIAFHSIELDPVQRFMPRLTIYFEDKDLPTITQILGDRLPRSDRRPDIIDRISRYLQF